MKPIFIVKLSGYNSDQDVSNIQEMLYEKMGADYYIIVVSINDNIQETTFECYNTSDLDVKSFQELKEIVNQNINHEG